jgi:hypothetical protein
MAIRKGAILPKDIQSLVGRQVYWAVSAKKLAWWKEYRDLHVVDLTPHKLYTIESISLSTYDEGETHVMAYIIDDGGDSLNILLGRLPCGHLNSKFHWSLKQLPAVAVAVTSIEDKSNGSL